MPYKRQPKYVKLYISGVSRMKKHLITILIGLGIVAVFTASYLNGGNKHGDPETWISERHAAQIAKNPEKTSDFCLKCHAKLREEQGFPLSRKDTLDNYCNDCHAKSGVGNVTVEITEE